MTIKEIKEKIISDAQIKADEIIFQAESEANELINKGKKEAENIKNNILTKNRQEALLRKNKILTEAHLNARKTLLSEKQSIMEDVFNKALENILKMDDRKYCQFIKKIILDNIDNGKEIISIGEADKKRVTNAFIDEINHELKSNGKKGELKLDNHYIQIKGGIIIGSGNIKKNISLEQLLQKVREEYEMVANKQLFE
jgi:V/A-type H+-transporting ATPase subunit E